MRHAVNTSMSLYRFWNYYYQIRSLTLWDYQKDTGIDADFDAIIK